MLPYAVSFVTFHLLLAISTLLAAFLFYSYHRLGRNVIMRTMCILVLVVYLTIMAGLIINGPDYDGEELLPEPNAICMAQSIILNYCFVALQALGCGLMLDNCIKGFQWKLSWLEPFGHESLCLSIALLIPLIPTLLFGLRLPGLPVGSVQIQPFYSVMSPPIFLTSALWFLLFAVPGTIFACLFLYRIHRYSRQNRLRSGSSQVTTATLIRLTMVVLIYVAMALGSLYPVLRQQPATNLTSWPAGGGEVPSKAVRSPWLNPNMCTQDTSDPYLYFYQRMRCPRPHSFVPALIGLGLFLMYGFSDTSLQVYRAWRRRISVFLGREKRRSSHIPSHGQVTPNAMEEAPTEPEVDEEEERLAALMIFGSSPARIELNSPATSTLSSGLVTTSSPTTSTHALFNSPLNGGPRRHTMPAIRLAEPIPRRTAPAISQLRFVQMDASGSSDLEDVAEGAHQRQESPL